MKKTYQAPETRLAAMALDQLLANSNNYGSPEAGQDLSTVGETTEISGNLSRRLWDDEDSQDEDF